MRTPKLRPHIISEQGIKSKALHHRNRVLGECDCFALKGRIVMSYLHVDIVHGKELVSKISVFARGDLDMGNWLGSKIPVYDSLVLEMLVRVECKLVCAL